MVGLTMQTNYLELVVSVGVSLCLFLGGCEPTATPHGRQRELLPRSLTKPELGVQIGELAEVLASRPLLVEGYGIVAGLPGTGSAQCPPAVRGYLMQYILRQLPKGHSLSVDEFISSNDTAVVRIFGFIPPAAVKGERFDVWIEALAGTQTSSLADGRLYTAELKIIARYGAGQRSSRALAIASGQVFMDTIGGQQVDLRSGYVLNGGEVLNDYKIRLSLREPDYKSANIIRNRLNERFGPDTAQAVSEVTILLNIPTEYRQRRADFIALVKATYIGRTSQLTKKRISYYVRRLATSPEEDASEVALEAIGRQALEKLPILLNSSNEEVRFRAARCILRLGSNEGLETLQKMAFDRESPWRIAAIKAIGTTAERNDAISTLSTLLGDKDFDVRYASYEQLCRLDDISVTRKLIAGDFYLDTVNRPGPKVIYVSRSGSPRIVLFGGVIRCEDKFYVESADGNIILDASEQSVSIIRKNPRRPGLVGPALKVSSEIADIITALSEKPVIEQERTQWAGLGVSYSETIAILEQMVAKGAVKAEFRPGPGLKKDIIVKKSGLDSR